MELYEIGQQIQKARKNKKLSQQKLGDQLRISRATLSGIENGTVHEIGIRKIISICLVLGLELIVKEKTTRPTLQQLMEDQRNA
jgi:HTH-type transcriptional regulator / antitoxin HipB